MLIYGLDPWGEERKDLRAGIVAATVAVKYARPGHTPKPSDFMPTFGEAKRQRAEQPLAVMKAQFNRAAARWNKGDESGSGQSSDQHDGERQTLQGGSSESIETGKAVEEETRPPGEK